jgi:hypothetical protein
MAVEWAQVLTDAIKAAESRLGGNWTLVQQAATIQVTALIENAKSIEDNKNAMTPDEYEFVKRIQTRALSGVLAGFEAIGIVAAEQAAEAAWNVAAAALKTEAGIFFV